MIKLIEKRRQGLSTGRVMEAMGRASQEPGRAVQVFDHAVSGRAATRLLFGIAQNIIEELELDFRVEEIDNGIQVISIKEPLFTGDDGLTYKRA